MNKALQVDVWKRDQMQLGALRDFANANDAAEVIRTMEALYAAVGAHWPAQDRKRQARLVKGAHEAARGWFDAIIARKDLKDAIHEVGAAVTDVTGSYGFFYNDSDKRFQLGLSEDVSAEPHALVAYAALPLFDDRAGWRERLGRCQWPRCAAPYFFVFGKRSGQRYCSPQHANIDHVYRSRYQDRYEEMFK